MLCPFSLKTKRARRNVPPALPPLMPGLLVGDIRFGYRGLAMSGIEKHEKTDLHTTLAFKKILCVTILPDSFEAIMAGDYVEAECPGEDFVLRLALDESIALPEPTIPDTLGNGMDEED